MTKEKIRQVMDIEYERMYPFEIERELSAIFKLAEESKDESVKQEILWEVDLLNRVVGHVVVYQGKDVAEISNKWGLLLETGEFKPILNAPFCEWKREALDYYKVRYNQTKSSLAKARYAFAIMVFSSGSERIEWVNKSVDNWLKTAEDYINKKVYNKEYYEIPPFAYEFALKLSLSFGKKDLAKKILESLHKSIISILGFGERRWYLEFLEVESKYINSLDNFDEVKKESVKKIKEIIKQLELEFEKSEDKQKSNHFIRHHLRILMNYETEDEYELNQKIAESYITEAEVREEPLVKSSFYNDAVKKYKEMQCKYSDKKQEIGKRLEELILKMKDINSKINYKTIQAEIEITKEQIDEYLNYLKNKNKDLLTTFLEDNSLFPKYNQTIKMTEDQKKQYPFQFIVPIVVYSGEDPIIKMTNDVDIFDHKVRRNILLGLKISEIMCKIVFESLRKGSDIDVLKTMETLISQDEIKNIKPTLSTGFNYVFGEKKDFVAGLHILTPYIEEVIRMIIKKAGKVEVVLEQHKNKFFRNIELGGLLSDKNVEELIGLDFQKSLKVMFIDNDQSNIRNELLHGGLSSDRINESLTLFVSYILLKLIKILKETDPNK
jgi:hypothetical protein